MMNKKFDCLKFKDEVQKKFNSETKTLSDAEKILFMKDKVSKGSFAKLKLSLVNKEYKKNYMDNFFSFAPSEFNLCSCNIYIGQHKFILSTKRGNLNLKLQILKNKILIRRL